MKNWLLHLILAGLCVFVGFAFGVRGGLSWWADRCEAGDMVTRNGMVYDCRAYQAPKVRKGT